MHCSTWQYGSPYLSKRSTSSPMQMITTRVVLQPFAHGSTSLQLTISLSSPIWRTRLTWAIFLRGYFYLTGIDLVTQVHCLSVYVKERPLAEMTVFLIVTYLKEKRFGHLGLFILIYKGNLYSLFDPIQMGWKTLKVSFSKVHSPFEDNVDAAISLINADERYCRRTNLDTRTKCHQKWILFLKKLHLQKKSEQHQCYFRSKACHHYSRLSRQNMQTSWQYTTSSGVRYF